MNVTSELSNSSKARRRFSGKQLWALGGMCLVVILLYVVLGSLLLTKTGEAPAAVQVAQLARTSLSLQGAQQAAQDVAQSWQPDALLVGATTSWQLAAGERLTLSRTAWSFSFYSPLANKVQVVVADSDGAALLRRTRVNTAPQPVQADWSLDSDGLLLTFMANGGEEFLKFHSFANIHAQLKAVDAGRAVWILSAVDPVARESFTVSVDALSRQIVAQD